MVSPPSSASSAHQQAERGLNDEASSNRIRIKIRVPGKKRPKDGAYSNGGDGKSIQEIDEFRYVGKKGEVQKRWKGTGGAVDGSQKFVKAAKRKKMPKDGYVNGGLKSNGKGIDEVDELIYVVGKDGVRKRCKGEGRAAANMVENLKSKSGLLEFLSVLKAVFGAMDRVPEDVDFVDGTNRRERSVFPRSSIFPRPRWWPRECDSDNEGDKG